MQQQHRRQLFDRPLRQLFMNPVQWITGLKCDDICAIEGCEAGASLGGSEAQVPEIIMPRQLQHLKSAGEIYPAPAVHLSHQWVTGVSSREYLFGYFIPIPFVNLIKRHQA